MRDAFFQYGLVYLIRFMCNWVTVRPIHVSADVFFMYACRLFSHFKAASAKFIGMFIRTYCCSMSSFVVFSQVTQCIHHLSPKRLSTPPSASLAPSPSGTGCAVLCRTSGNARSTVLYLFTPVYRARCCSGSERRWVCSFAIPHLPRPWARLHGARMDSSIRPVSEGSLTHLCSRIVFALSTKYGW